MDPSASLPQPNQLDNASRFQCPGRSAHLACFVPAKFLRRSFEVLFIFLMFFAASGFRFRPASFENLQQRAEAVIRARVLSKECLEDSRGQIYTRVTLQIMEVWKGALKPGAFQLVLGGGILGQRQTRVSGQVNYVPGEEVVVFLKRNDSGEWITVEMAEGRIPVERSATGSAGTIRLRQFRANGSTEFISMSLDSFRQKVQGAVRETTEKGSRP